MRTIYSDCLESIEMQGKPFHINFKQRSLKLNGKYIIRDGKFEGELGICKCKNLEEFISEVEERYERYKYSVPSRLSNNNHIRTYFKALKESEINDEDMMFGYSRAIAKFELEMYILCQWLLGFSFDSISVDKWFWQSESDKDLVLIKDWF